MVSSSFAPALRLTLWLGGLDGVEMVNLPDGLRDMLPRTSAAGAARLPDHDVCRAYASGP